MWMGNGFDVWLLSEEFGQRHAESSRVVLLGRGRWKRQGTLALGVAKSRDWLEN